MAQQEAPKFSLLSLQEHLRKVIAFNMKEPLWIVAELTEANPHRGNWYLSLIEKNEREETVAKANAFLARRDALEIQKKHSTQVLEQVLRPGQRVLLWVQVRYHEVHGLSLDVKMVDASFSLGQAALERAKTQQMLEDEGAMKKNKRHALPKVIQRLAIISSREAAGLQDFIQHLQHNAYGYAFAIDLYPSAMQGSLVEREVLDQLQKIEANVSRYDAVILVRGGGAKTDLMAFDGLNLCRAIAAHPLPVLTGIGHDEDISLADLVANRSFKTPTAVADFLLERCLQLEQQASYLHQQIQFLVQQRLGQEQQRLGLWAQRLPLLLQQYSQQKGFELQRLEQRLQLLNLDYTLQRGFALVLSPKGQVLPTVAAVQEDKLEIRLQDGSLMVEVKEKKIR